MKSIRTENFTRLVESTNFMFLDSMEDLVRIRDDRGEILFENKAMREMITILISNNETYNKYKTVFSGFYKEYINSNEKNSLISEVDFMGTLYSVKISPVYDNRSDILGFIEVYRDITNERKITDQLFETSIKIQEEIELAKTLQKSILPKKTQFKNVSFQYGYEPSADLSGDVFDVVEINKDKIGVYIADVVGHGISASIMTMFIRQSMRSVLIENPNFGPSDSLRMLKEMFSQLGLDVSQYFSIFYILIDFSKEKMIYANAGHNCMPILFNKSHLAFLQNNGKFISNMFPDGPFNEKELNIIEGDKLLIYTDGLVETTNSDGEFFGEERLVNWIKRNKNEKDFVNKLLETVNLFSLEDKKDDVAMVFLKIGGEQNES